MRSPTPNAPALGLFWFGIQVVWGALLGVSLQARASDLAGVHALSAYGTLAAVGASIAALTQIAVGVISDRRRTGGSKRIEFYFAGALVAAAAIVWFYAARSFAELVASVIVLQVGMNVAIGPYQAAIPDFIREERLGAASSWMAALQSAGNAAGALLAGLVANSRAVSLAIAATLLATCAGTAAHVRTLTLLPAQTRGARVSRAFADLFVSRAFVFLGFYTLLGYLFFYVRRSLNGDVKTLTGVLILIVTAAAAAGAIGAARPSAFVDRRLLADAGGVAFIAGLCAFLFSHTFVEFAASACVAGAAWGVFITGDWALGCQLLPRHALATAMGIWNLALLLPQIAAPILATALLSAFHALHGAQGPRIAFILAACEVAAGVAWLSRLPAVRPVAEKRLPLS